MNTKNVLLVILFSLQTIISCNSGNNSTANTTETNQTNLIEEQSFETDTNRRDTEKQITKANSLLEKALKLLHESNEEIDIRNAYSLLEESAKLNNKRAKEMVAKSHLFGDHLPLDARKAFEFLESIPMNQSARAHLLLGFMYSMGLGVSKSQEKCLMHYRIAAHLNNSLAKMAIAFRYNHGFGLQRNCHKALKLYQSVAIDVVDDSQNVGGPPIIGRYLYKTNDKSSVNSDTIDRDLINYYNFLAKSGDTKARVSLGQLYYYGGYGIQRDRNRAFNYFRKAAESGNENALAFIGKYHLDGSPPIKQNITKAFELFMKSAEKGNPIAMTELGLMYKEGKGMNIDFEKAFKLFARSSKQGWVDAILQLGTMYLYGLGVSRDYRMAVKYLTFASQSKHLLATYNLGELHASGVGVMRSCPKALLLLKSVAERGIWSEMVTQALDDYRIGLISQAFIKLAFLSEMGYELAQSNTAFILEKYGLNLLKQGVDIGPNMTFDYWKASAAQGSSFSRIKVGDHYYYGLGTPVNYKMAVYHYQRASEYRYSAQALFNLGYLSEKGLGMDKNLKMAKIYYDMSVQVDGDGKIPIFLAKTKLMLIETKEKFIECIDLRKNFGSKWDLILIALLSIILVSVLYLKLCSV